MRQKTSKLYLVVLLVAMSSTAGCSLNIESLEQKQDVSGLIKALNHEDPEVRRRAASALGSIGDPRAIEPLDFMLRGGRDSLFAAKALGQIGGRHAVSSLMWALKTRDSDLQEAAIAGLVELGEPAVEPLIAALKEWKMSPDKQAAARALGYMGEPAVEPLIAALNHPANNVCELAAEALGQIGDPRAVEPLLALPCEVDDLAGPLGQIGEPAFEPLLTALNHSDRRVRMLAALALGKMGDPRAVEPLIAALKDPDFPSETAAEALGQIGDLRAVEPLIAAMAEKRVYVNLGAESALVQIGLDDPSILVPFLKDASTVRVYRPLIRIGDPATLSALVTALDAHGYKAMAEAYLNSGNDTLEAAARQWGKDHGYMAMPRFGGGSSGGWGSK